MSDEPVTMPSGPRMLPPSSPFHPSVGADASLDACPYGPMLKGLNVDPNLIFDILQQYFGGGEAEDADDADGCEAER